MLTRFESLQQNVLNQRASSEFKNEVLTMSKIEHLNLVRLYGYLEHGDEKIIVEEYISGGTLREHLDGKLATSFIPEACDQACIEEMKSVLRKLVRV